MNCTSCDSAMPSNARFCPSCGSTVWWEALARPGRIAVAAGAFADKDFPAPQRLIWAEHKAAWVRASWKASCGL